MISLKNKQKGFTIVELLIVIVVIGILAAIVIVTFTGVQKKARDSDRKSDINATSGLLEVYFADKGQYPTLGNLNSPNTATGDWRFDNMKDLKDPLITAPGSTTAALVSGAGTTSAYGYVTIPGTCDNSVGNECTGYTLTGTLEQGAPFVKNGANN